MKELEEKEALNQRRRKLRLAEERRWKEKAAAAGGRADDAAKPAGGEGERGEEDEFEDAFAVEVKASTFDERPAGGFGKSNAAKYAELAGFDVVNPSRRAIADL